MRADGSQAREVQTGVGSPANNSRPQPPWQPLPRLLTARRQPGLWAPRGPAGFSGSRVLRVLSVPREHSGGKEEWEGIETAPSTHSRLRHQRQPQEKQKVRPAVDLRAAGGEARVGTKVGTKKPCGF